MIPGTGWKVIQIAEFLPITINLERFKLTLSNRDSYKDNIIRQYFFSKAFVVVLHGFYICCTHDCFKTFCCFFVKGCF